MLPEYFEFYNPVKLLCGQWSLENIPYELGRLRVKKPLMLVSGTMLQQGILQMMGEPMPMVLESGHPTGFLLRAGRAAGCARAGRGL